jgi:hypothetical protein
MYDVSNRYSYLSENIMNALYLSSKGELEKRKANIKVYLNNPVGIGEHSDITNTIQLELDKMIEADDRINIITKYFDDIDVKLVDYV